MKIISPLGSRLSLQPWLLWKTQGEVTEVNFPCWRLFFFHKKKLIIPLNFYLSLLTVHFQSCYAEKKPCRGDGLRSGQVWGGPPKLNLNFIIFWLLRTTGLKRSPFGQTSVRFQGEHHVKRTPGEYWVTKFTLTCLTASKSWEPAE